MKKMVLVIVLLLVAVNAQARGTNGKRCVVDSQCGWGVCVIGPLGGSGTCAGDLD